MPSPLTIGFTALGATDTITSTDNSTIAYANTAAQVSAMATGLASDLSTKAAAGAILAGETAMATESPILANDAKTFKSNQTIGNGLAVITDLITFAGDGVLVAAATLNQWGITKETGILLEEAGNALTLSGIVSNRLAQKYQAGQPTPFGTLQQAVDASIQSLTASQQAALQQFTPAFNSTLSLSNQSIQDLLNNSVNFQSDITNLNSAMSNFQQAANSAFTQKTGVAADSSTIQFSTSTDTNGNVTGQKLNGSNGTSIIEAINSTTGSTAVNEFSQPNGTGVNTNTITSNSDGTLGIQNYNPSPTISSTLTQYNDPLNIGVETGLTTSNTNGSSSVEAFDTSGDAWANATRNYNTSGALATMVTNNNDGSSRVDTYNAGGEVAVTQNTNADHSYDTISFSLGSGSYASVTDNYTNGGALAKAAVTNADNSGFANFYNAGGQITQYQTTNADSSYVNQFTDLSGGNWSALFDNYSATGQLTQASLQYTKGGSAGQINLTTVLCAIVSPCNADSRSRL